MTTADFLKRLCEGYVRSYRTLNLRTEAKWTDLTQRELHFFVQLGEMLGFAARLEAQRMDLSWHDLDTGELVLHLERETEAGRVLNETLPKLLRPEGSRQARYLAAVLGWVREEDLPPIKQRIAKELGGRPLLLIAWVGPTKEEAKCLEAFVFSGSEVHTRRGEGETDRAGYWYAWLSGEWKMEEVSGAVPA
jgi:hypothetical protein